MGLFSWIAENESTLSGVAAIIAIVAGIVGVILSPLGAGARSVLFRKKGAPPAQADDGHSSTSNLKSSSDPVNTGDSDQSTTGKSKGRPVVAVLPFNNMSTDEEQGYLAEGMTEDIITALARSPDMDVIARNSTFVYKDTNPDIRQVGKDLGARYVVEGSLRKVGSEAVGERIRVTVQLIEAATGNHVWAENYDRPLTEIFAIQDEVSSGIASALGYAITVAEIDKANRANTDNLDAWGLVARSLSAAFQFNRETSAESVSFARQAVALDPNYAAAHARLASALIRRPVNGFSEDPAQDLADANTAIDKAMRLAPNDAGVLAEYGHVLVFSGRSDEAIPVLKRSLSLCPSNGIAIATYGFALGCNGDYEEALAELTRAETLLPNAQYLYRIYFWRGTTRLAQGDYTAGEMDLRHSLSIYRGFLTTWILLAVSLVQQNKTQEAQAALKEIIAIQSDMLTSDSRNRLSVVFPHGMPKPLRDGMDQLEKIWPEDISNQLLPLNN